MFHAACFYWSSNKTASWVASGTSRTRLLPRQLGSLFLVGLLKHLFSIEWASSLTMGSTTPWRMLLRSLCHDTPWIYALFWKLNFQSNILALEDGYIDNAKLDVTLINAVDHAFTSGRASNASFGCEMGPESEKSVVFPIEIAVANMSRYSCTVGEGVIGTVASADTHIWIYTTEHNLKMFSDCHMEWELQLAADIKTVLLVPIIPLGVVQLGSCNMVLEDLNAVAYIKDLFSKHAPGAYLDQVPRLGLANPSSSPPKSMIEISPGSSALAGNLSDPFAFLQSRDKHMTALGIFDVARDEVSAIDPYLFPLLATEDFPPLEVTLAKVPEINAESSAEESLWKLMYKELLVDATDGLGEDGCKDGLSSSPINNSLVPENVLRRNDREHDYCHASCIKSASCQMFTGNFEADDVINDELLNFPADCELHKALGLRSWKQPDDFICNGFLSKAAQPNYFPGIYEALMDESSSWLLKDNGGEDLLAAVSTKLCHASDNDASPASRYTKSYDSSSANFSGSCLTHCKNDGGVLELDDHSLAAVTKRRTNSVGQYSCKSTCIKGEEQEKRAEELRRCVKRKMKDGNSHKSRPRDRQLIQDRVKELRVLIPNGSNCSIDSLLDRTVKHMFFLQNLSCQAEKLRHLSRPKIKDGNSGLAGSRAHKHHATWAYQLGTPQEAYPLIVENLGQPEHLLVEMLCEEYGLFLEIAQVIRSMRLTILEGVLESKSKKLWAHFIIETSRGFHRMDILLPLMRLLRKKRPTML